MEMAHNYYLMLPQTVGGAYSPPSGDFSTLVRLSDGTFQRTLKDKTVYQFNTQNKLSTVTDVIGNTTQYIYDATGLLSSYIDPVGLTTTLTYSGTKLSSITDPTQRITKLSYDAAGNLILIKEPNTATTAWDYDSNHHMTDATDSMGNHGIDVYDSAGRIKSATLKDGSIVQIAPSQVQGLYSAVLVSQLTGTSVDGNGNVKNNFLDGFGSNSGSLDGVGPGSTTIRSNENLVTQTNTARGYATNYTYDSQGNVLTVQDAISQGAIAPITSGSLFAHQLYSTTTTLSQITTGDLNNDGIPDVIGINSNKGTLSVLLGNGFGFNSATTIPLVGTPTAITVGDVNGDGNKDLTIIHSGNNAGYGVLLGNAQGTFVTSKQYQVGANPTSTLVTDLNNDGTPDVIVANSGSNTVSVLLNIGNGTYGTKTDYIVGNNPSSVVVGDINSDGVPDLITTNSGDNTVSVLLGITPGTFKTKIDYAVGINPSSVVVGDINSDGNSDLIVALSTTVSVLLNNGNGTYSPKTDYSLGGPIKSVQLQDLNNDGQPDLVVAVGSGYGDDVIDVLLNPGSGNFSTPTNYTSPRR